MINLIFFSSLLFAQPFDNLQQCLASEARVYVEGYAATGRMTDGSKVDLAYEAMVNSQDQFCTYKAMTLTGKNTKNQMIAEICSAIEKSLLNFYRPYQVDTLFRGSESCRRVAL